MNENPDDSLSALKKFFRSELGFMGIDPGKLSSWKFDFTGQNFILTLDTGEEITLSCKKLLRDKSFMDLAKKTTKKYFE